MSAPSVPSRKHGESELDHLLRKEALWGLWQADALERMQQQDQTIDAMQARIDELEKTLSYAKNSAEGVAKLIAYGLHSQDPSPAQSRPASPQQRGWALRGARHPRATG